MPGEPDQLYVEARRALLDALEALAPHRDSLILVGAQAIYLHTGEADVAVAPYTKDADVAIDPRHLGRDPILEVAMQAAGFEPGDQPGTWTATATLAQVDLPSSRIPSAALADIVVLRSRDTAHVPRIVSRESREPSSTTE